MANEPTVRERLTALEAALASVTDVSTPTTLAADVTELTKTVEVLDAEVETLKTQLAAPRLPSVTPTPLVTVADFKRYAKIETIAEDDLLGELLVEVVGLIESFTGKSLTTAPLTWTDDAESFRFYGPQRSLILPYMQIDPATIAVVNGAGETLDPAGYTVRLDLRQIRGTFACGGPYVITCTAGYGTLPDYKPVWLPRIRATIIDYASFLYQQRTPGASSEGASSTRVDYGAIDPDTGLPHRLCMALRKLRGIIV